MGKPFPAYQGDDPYVFVCYAHGDARLVYPEMRWLRDQGINIWYDEGISPGEEFPQRLADAILGSSLVIFFATPTSVSSRHCRDEAYFALDHNRQLLTVHLMPTDLPAGLALSTGTAQAIMRYEMRTGDYRRKLLSGIRQQLASGTDQESAQPLGPTSSRVSRLARYAVPLILLAVAAIIAVEVNDYLHRQAEVRRAKDELLPRIRNQLDDNWRDFTETYALAVEAEKMIPDDAELRQIFEKISLDIDIDSEPPGADVYMKAYGRPEDEWTHLGVTPIEAIRTPVGIFRWKFEKAGFETVLAAASSWDISISDKELLHPNHLQRTLDPIDRIPDGMVRVAGAQTPQGDIADFYMDRHEVTNAEFHRFVLQGGYGSEKFWKHPFIEDGRELGREEAVSRFVDQTGRPGPSSWLGGIFPDGRANHPVSGVSWYEAAAYAEFAGKSLPTGTHWGVARGEYSPLIRFPQLGGFAVFAPFSNFGGNGTVEVGSLPGITAYGAVDLAGNVREWCWNDTSQGKLVRGGAWSDNPYRFAELSQAPPLFRMPGYGFRTVLYPDDVDQPAAVFADVPITPPSDFRHREVVSDEVFAAFRRQFDYDDVELRPQQESPLDSSELWTLERVSIATPYDDDRMVINLFLPRNSSPPYQTVIYFPGSASLFQDSSENIDEYYEFPVFLSFLVRTGRAVAYPVYQGTFERRSDETSLLHMGQRSHAYTEYLVQVVKDFRRTIDYLETRDDIDAGRLAYYGMSWGGTLGAIIPAVETRPKTAILLAGGLYDTGQPESSGVNYAPRIDMPFLILVGRYDTILGYESSAKPLFDLIGTPEDHKVMKVYETDHIPPKSEYVAEILSWLDLYLGPVQQGARAAAN
jgi:dienelactone hydrolase